MKLPPEIKLFNSYHDAMTIFPATEEYVASFIREETTYVGFKFLVTDASVGKKLGYDAMLPCVVDSLLEDARKEGKYVYAIDVSRENGRYSFRLCPDMEEGKNYVCYLVAHKDESDFPSDEEFFRWVGKMIDRLALFVNETIFFVKTPPNSDILGYHNPYASAEKAIEAIQKYDPEFRFREEDFEVSYHLKKSA